MSRKYSPRNPEIKVTCINAGIPTEYVDFDGTHLTLTGTVAFCYRGYRLMFGEEEARRQMMPWLVSAKRAEDARIEKARAMITANNHRSDSTAFTGNH